MSSHSSCSYCSAEICQQRVLQVPGVLQQLLKLRYMMRNESLPAKLIFRMSLSLENHHYLAAPELVNLLLSVVNTSVSEYRKSQDESEEHDYWSVKGNSSEYHQAR